MSREEMLTIQQAAEELGVSLDTFYRWRSTGKGPKALKLPNGSVRIRRSAMNRFLVECEERV